MIGTKQEDMSREIYGINPLLTLTHTKHTIYWMVGDVTEPAALSCNNQLKFMEHTQLSSQKHFLIWHDKPWEGGPGQIPRNRSVFSRRKEDISKDPV